jgi:hypothetical protein
MFERSSRFSPFAETANESGGEILSRKFLYLRLMQVSIRHNYYNRGNGECPDFNIYPTARSAALMQNLGLLFKDEGTGFSILYDAHREDVLFRYLRRQEWPEGTQHCWTRLSFVLSLNNPYFLNFTELPIGLNTGNQNFYFTSQNARRQPGGEIILNPGAEQELLTRIPVQFGVVVSNVVKEIEVQDIAQVYEQSRDTVICRPRCVPVDLLNKGRNLASITCEEAKRCKGLHEPKSDIDPICQCTNKIYLDFSTLPEDKYTIKQVRYPAPLPAPPDQPVLYTESYPMPFCFIDLFFTSPTGVKPKLFPVQNLFGPEKDWKIETVNYELKFERRLTYWNYFIVPQSGETLENLRIEGEAGIQFNGPCRVYLPNGMKAYRFVSKKPLPFMQQSPYRFRLTGEIGLTAQNSILMSRLPVASVEQVLQDELTACLSLDGSIYPGAKTECRKLKAQICGCVCAGFSMNDCLRKLKLICRDPESPKCRERRLGCSKIYSDTYVYV